MNAKQDTLSGLERDLQEARREFARKDAHVKELLLRNTAVAQSVGLCVCVCGWVGVCVDVCV